MMATALVRRLLLANLLMTVVVCVPAAQRRGAPDNGGTSLPRGTVVRRNMPYTNSGDAKQQLDLYVPDASHRRPGAVIAVHGGAWRKGSKQDQRVMSGVSRLLRAGFTVAAVDYRLTDRAKFPAQIHDIKAAVRWLRASAAKYGFDAERVGAWGTSAGGHLVALMGTSGDVAAMDGTLGPSDQSARVQAVVDWFGPTDLLQMDAQKRPDGISHNGRGSPESRLLGGPIQTMKAAADAANPITYITPDDPPFLIAHGDRDRMVPVRQSELLHQALRKAGVPSELRIVAGAGHGFENETALGQMVEFFSQRLVKPKSTDRISNSDRDKAISRVQNLDARALDAALPQQKLGAWMGSFLPSKATIGWEQTECGEFTGQPKVDSQRAATSQCVTASAMTESRWEVGVRVYVGSNLTGVLDEKPRLYEAFVSRQNDFHVADSLHELPGLVQKYVGK